MRDGSNNTSHGIKDFTNSETEFQELLQASMKGPDAWWSG